MDRRFLLASAATLLATPALAQSSSQRARTAQEQNGTAASNTPGANARTEAVPAAQFVRMAAMSDLFEIQSSRLAEQQAQSQAVKRFAQHMLRDHQKTTQELTSLVSRSSQQPSGFELPANLDSAHQQMMTQLQNARGQAFDQLFKQQQVSAHQEAVDLFRNYSQQGDNADLKRWAGAQLPTLQEHLRDAQAMRV